MALTTYTELKAAVADFAHRTDLTTPIVDCVTLAEARLYDMLILKDMESDESLTLTIGRNYVALPTGYISPIAFWLVIEGERFPLQAALPQELPYSSGNSQPELWAVDAANIRFDCPAQENYSAYLRMVKKTALSGSVASNYLLTRRPDIYLAGTMVEVARYTRDAALFNTWEPKFLKACAEFKAAENRARGIVRLRSDIPSALTTGSLLAGE
jgi:hypothetical protein